MSITQQYLLDIYRARQRGEPAAPAPGSHDWQVVREVRDDPRFRAVVAGLPVRGRFRAAVARRLHGWRRRPTR